MAWSVSGNIRGPQGVQGVQGPQGTQGPQGATGSTGVSAINYQGVWSNTTAYAKGDLVSLNGGSFIAPQPVRQRHDRSQRLEPVRG